MRANEFITEAWSQKYKNSINCSHPKGFSQRAHCAGKKKHNESIETEMVCEDCGMCQTHGNLNEIKKGEKDSNGYTRCWPGKHAEGTKTGKNGGQVRNCVPNESIEESEGKRCMQCGMKNCKCPGDSCKCKPIAGWIPGKGFRKAMDEAANAASRQAAIAINMKKHHQKPKGVSEDLSRRGFLKGAGAATVAGAAGYKLGQNNTSDNTNPYTTDKLSSEDLNAIDTFLTWYTLVKRHGKPSFMNPGNIMFDVNLELGTVEDLIKVYGKDFIFARLKKIQDRVFAMSDQEVEKEFNRIWKGADDAAKQAYIHNKLLPDYRLNKESVEQGMSEAICSLEEAHAIFDDFEQAMAARGLTEDAFDTITDEDIIRETAAWRRSAGKSKKGGLNRKGVMSYRREHPGSHLQMAVTTKPSKLKPGSKAAKRRKSFCARMSGVKGPMKKPNGKPTRKALALRKWNC